MQNIDVPYVDLEHTLKCIKIQVIDSLNFVSDFIPNTIQSPEGLFYFLKPQISYKKDPKGIELIQEAETLINNGGRGDCDCFTVLGLSSAYKLGFNPLYVVLVGNSKLAPTHIYMEVYDKNKGKIVPFDLTNPKYNMERKYKFKQRIPFKI